MIRPPEQTWIDGMRPPDVPDVEPVKLAIYHWLDRKVNQKRAAEETRAAHAAMIASLAEAKLDWHPYTDPSNGRKRRVWIAKEPKAKTSVVVEFKPKRGRKRRGGADRSADAVIDPDAEPKEDTKVESRRVPRKSVEDDIDPMRKIREGMKGGVLDDAEAAQRGELPPPTHANGVSVGRAIKRPKKRSKRK